MSVDFTAEMGYGYILNWDDIVWLETHTDGAIWDYVYTIDCYSDPKNVEYFFGVHLLTLAPGEYRKVADFVLLTVEDIIKRTDKLRQMLIECGLSPEEPKWREPHVYVYNRIS